MFHLGECSVKKCAVQELKTKSNHKKDGFVLALAVVILGVALTIATLIITLITIQFSNNELLTNKIEKDLICEQVEYDFYNLSKEEFQNHILSLGATKDETNQNIFVFENKIYIKLIDNFKKVQIFEIKNNYCLLELVKQ